MRTRLEPGIYEAMPFSDYLRVDAMNHSSLVHCERSALHCMTAFDGRSDEPTDAMRIGSGLHCRVLEPHLWDSRVVTPPACAKRSQADKETWAAFRASVRPDQIVLDADEQARVLVMAAAIAAKPRANALVSRSGRSEVTVVWDDPVVNMRCKARVDKWFPEAGVALDIKTTRDASEYAFADAVENYWYHSQFAWYARGLAVVTQAAVAFSVVAVENEAPWDVAVYTLDDEAMNIGAGYCEKWLRRLAAGPRSGYEDAIKTLSLPTWSVRRAFTRGAIHEQ